MRPLVLLSNDDGVDSPHLAALAAGLRENLGAEVLVAAPERQRSAMSHTITLHKPLRVIEREQGVYAVSGSPVDCVYIGLLKLAPRPPALVISGINDGFNLGTDVFYSGTVGAAIEGGLRGVPSLAVSLEPRAEGTLPTAVRIATDVARHMLETPLPERTVVNLNVPADPKDLVWTRLGRRFYEDDVHERRDPRGRAYYWIGGGDAGAHELADSDCDAVYSGRASLTPLMLDLTAHHLLGDARPSWPLKA